MIPGEKGQPSPVVSEERPRQGGSLLLATLHSGQHRGEPVGALLPRITAHQAKPEQLKAQSKTSVHQVAQLLKTNQRLWSFGTL